MRTLGLATLVLIPALALGACESSGREHSTSGRYARDDMGRLQRECDRRGGMLVPTGRLSIEPALNYVCDVTNSQDQFRRR